MAIYIDPVSTIWRTSNAKTILLMRISKLVSNLRSLIGCDLGVTLKIDWTKSRKKSKGSSPKPTRLTIMRQNSTFMKTLLYQRGQESQPLISTHTVTMRNTWRIANTLTSMSSAHTGKSKTSGGLTLWDRTSIRSKIKFSSAQDSISWIWPNGQNTISSRSRRI